MTLATIINCALLLVILVGLAWVAHCLGGI